MGSWSSGGPRSWQATGRSRTETADVLRDGWLYTGDLARMDDEGYFYIVDRKKDVINASGFKVWPREVEEVLFEHQDGGNGGRRGCGRQVSGRNGQGGAGAQEGVPRTSAEGEVQEELLKHCRSKLAAYKVPRLLEVQRFPTRKRGRVRS